MLILQRKKWSLRKVKSLSQATHLLCGSTQFPHICTHPVISLHLWISGLANAVGIFLEGELIISIQRSNLKLWSRWTPNGVKLMWHVTLTGHQESRGPVPLPSCKILFPPNLFFYIYVLSMRESHQLVLFGLGPSTVGHVFWAVYHHFPFLLMAVPCLS